MELHLDSRTAASHASATAGAFAASIAFVDCRGAGLPRAAEASLLKVCGLPILVRTLLVLERAGVERVYLLVEREHRGMIASAIGRHPRLRVPIEMLESQGDALAPAARAVSERPSDARVVVMPALLSLGRKAPDWPSAPLNGMLVGVDTLGGRDSGFVLTTVGVVRAHPDLSVPALAETLSAQGTLERLPLPRGAVTVRDRVAARLAERELLRSLRKDADGVVARFDRYVSLAISRHLMALPIKPNYVTAFAALVGLSCGFLVAHGGYAWMLVGALAFQFNSILDGVDGEIARAKLLESRSGQWLDTLSDDLSNLAFMVGVSVGSYRTWGAPAYLELGAVAGAGFLLSCTIMYHYLITRTHTGDLNDFVMPWNEGKGAASDPESKPSGAVSRLLDRVQWMFRRDTYVFLCTLFGVAGQLRFMVWLFAVGTTASWLSIVLYRALVSPLAGHGSEGA